MASIRQTFTPSSGNILVKVKEKQTSTIDIAQDADKEATSMGEVVAIGKERLHESGKFIGSGTKVGDTIVFGKYRADKIYLDNNEYRIVPFDNVKGILK